MLEEIFLCILSILFCFKIFQKMTHKTFVSEARIPDHVVIVTGSNTGIGYATAMDLSKRGARVILACRDINKAHKAAGEIELATGSKVIAKRLDLASFQSIRTFAKDILKTEKSINVLINNAGTGVLDNSLTEDNLPIEAQVNYFGPVLLTMLLLPVMKTANHCRIINVSSIMHRFGTVKNLDKQGTNLFQRRRVYSNTKLALVMFTRRLAKKLKDDNITVNCLHPGAVYTDIFQNQPIIIKYILKLLFLTPQEGAQTSIYLAVAPTLANVTGKYFSNCSAVIPSKKALDDKATEKLWRKTHKICLGNQG